MIEIIGLSVVFNKGTPLENPALQGVDLQIPAGQFITVIGSNGAGKSTLLNALAGEVPVERGSIRIDKEEVTQRPAALRSSLVARVFQDPLAGTCGELTVQENLALAMARGRRRRLRMALPGALRESFRSNLARLGLGLENRLEDRMSMLSGGQRQAVSLLMATSRPLKILLLDEPSAALDPRTATLMLQLIRRIVAERGLTALMVTHSMRQALQIGERTLMMDQGRIVFDVAGEQRSKLEISDLLRLFETARGEPLADDELLLG